MNVIEIAILILTILALAFFIIVLVDFAREYSMDKRHRKNEQRIAEEAFAIIVALCAYDQISEAEDKGGKGKKEVDDGEDKTL